MVAVHGPTQLGLGRNASLRGAQDHTRTYEPDHECAWLLVVLIVFAIAHGGLTPAPRPQPRRSTGRCRPQRSNSAAGAASQDVRQL